ncbi:MAG: BrnT family toxin [Gemmataceae bacterium]
MQDDNFEWDDAKAHSNFHKHGVTFGEAATAFADPMAVVWPDPDHSMEEERFLIIGVAASGRTLIVSHTDRDNRIRIISAREASRREQKGYEDGTFP